MNSLCVSVVVCYPFPFYTHTPLSLSISMYKLLFMAIWLLIFVVLQTIENERICAIMFSRQSTQDAIAKAFKCVLNENEYEYCCVIIVLVFMNTPSIILINDINHTAYIVHVGVLHSIGLWYCFYNSCKLGTLLSFERQIEMCFNLIITHYIHSLVKRMNPTKMMFQLGVC